LYLAVFGTILLSLGLICHFLLVTTWQHCQSLSDCTCGAIMLNDPNGRIKTSEFFWLDFGLRTS